MAKAGEVIGHTPGEVSFKVANDTLKSFHILLLQAAEGLIDNLLDHKADISGEQRVVNRPGRREARANKRHPEPTGKLLHTRKQARNLKEYQQ